MLLRAGIDADALFIRQNRCAAGGQTLGIG
jgi:hypothetical protein